MEHTKHDKAVREEVDDVTKEISDLERKLKSLKTTTSGGQLDKNKLILSLSIVVAAVLISGSILYANGMLGNGNGAAIGGGGPDAGGQPAGPVDVSEDDDPVLGDKDAKVTIIEFSDFQCPFCRSFFVNTLPQIKRDYIDTGKAKLVYRDFPLTAIHPAAEPSAQAAQCANDQNKFWEFHDKIFEEQQKLNATGTVQFSAVELKKWAGEVGLNTSTFNSCLDSGKYKDEVAKDAADGVNAGVTGTPSFFVNGNIIIGAQPYAAFQAAIESEL